MHAFRAMQCPGIHLRLSLPSSPVIGISKSWPSSTSISFVTPIKCVSINSFPSQLNEAMKDSKKENLVPLCSTLFSDHLTTVLVYHSLVQGQDLEVPSFLFESVQPGTHTSAVGRYSVVGARPTMEVVVKQNKVTVMDHEKGTVTTEEVEDPMVVPRRISETWKPQLIDDLPDAFTGGWVGYFSYDTVRYAENRKLPFSKAPVDDLNLPDIHLGLYDDVIVFDHLEKKIHVIHWVRLSGNSSFANEYAKGVKHLEDLVSRIKNIKTTNLPTGSVDLHTNQFGTPLDKSSMTSDAYKNAVLQAKEHILAGDIFQVVLSQRFERHTFANPFEVYRSLRIVNPSPCMCYLQARGCILVGSSPEILTRVKNNKIVNRTLAGTARRGKNFEEDQMLEKKLLKDEKQCAEHIMLVDLARNDVGKVTGELQENLTCWDTLRAALPVGTVSGAPKVKAMELIDELEVIRRGPYSGGFGSISFTGDMDIALAIRTIVFSTQARYDTMYSYKDKESPRREWVAYLQAGAGIVADSDPEDEYRECQNKAAGLARAIDLAESAFVNKSDRII